MQHVQCIFRKPQECKERHKILMDRGAGDGADSAEDSGSILEEEEAENVHAVGGKKIKK